MYDILTAVGSEIQTKKSRNYNKKKAHVVEGGAALVLPSFGVDHLAEDSYPLEERNHLKERTADGPVGLQTAEYDTRRSLPPPPDATR